MIPSLRSLLVFGTVFTANVCLAGPSLADVVLRGETEVNRAVVKLSDVFDGLPDGIDRDIARAPNPGKSITYDVNVLMHLSSEYKLDWIPKDHTEHFTVKTAFSHVSSDDIADVVIQKMRDQNVKGDMDVTFDTRNLELDLPGDRPANIALNNFVYEAANRRFHADLVADGLTGPITLPLQGHVTVKHTVPVLAHRLESGTTVGVADLDWISIPEDRSQSIITNAEALIGHELRRDTDGGQPIRERDVMPPRLVTRGALVTMMIETPLMTVTAQGRALQDGKIGDVVRVTNTQSQRMVEGTVEAAGVVRIMTAQRIAAANADLPGKQD
jgi:flagella basal body P-ring formation protein FlgA